MIEKFETAFANICSVYVASGLSTAETDGGQNTGINSQSQRWVVLLIAMATTAAAYRSQLVKRHAGRYETQCQTFYRLIVDISIQKTSVPLLRE